MRNSLRIIWGFGSGIGVLDASHRTIFVQENFGDLELSLLCTGLEMEAQALCDYGNKKQPEASFLFTVYFSSVRHLLSMHKCFFEFSLPLAWVNGYSVHRKGRRYKYPVSCR